MHLKETHKLSYPAHYFEPSDWLRFIHLGPFDRRWVALGLNDEDLRALQVLIMAAPDRHPIVKGAGGLRKLRFGRKDLGRGKSSAYRVCYVFFRSYSIVLLVTVYGIGEKSELSMEDRKAIAHITGLIEEQLRLGGIR